MKKIFFLPFFLIITLRVLGQYSEGGTPLSMDPLMSSLIHVQGYVQSMTLPVPNIVALQAEDRNHPQPGMFRIGALVSCDISLNNSGSMLLLPDGRKIWRMKILVPNMPALNLYYDQFHLPQGVQYYLYNANGKQILGAYTANENPDDSIWANEKIQGELINLEMDIDANVDMSQIAFHINNVGVYYKSIDYLSTYLGSAPNLKTTAPLFPYNGSSPCEVNAACSTTVGKFVNQSNATVHIEYINGGFVYGGTGVIVNNTKQDCKPYILTATHLEATNSTSNTTFSSWGFYFHYEAPACVYSGGQPSSQSMIGAYFRARASYNSSVAGIKGDFLLLELKKVPNSSYNYYYAGWDTSNSVVPLFGTFISYHHPSGDIKKVAVGTVVDPTGNFNASSGGMANSHWQITFTQGGMEEGSSGSGLFNSSGRLIGILSGGNNSSSCTDTNINGQTMNITAEYSKLSVDWGYTVQIPSTSASRLRDWLDPLGNHAKTLDGMTMCTAATAEIQNIVGGIEIYPNPVKDIVNIKVADNVESIRSELYNLMGSRMEITVKKVSEKLYHIDIGKLPAGIYILNVLHDSRRETYKIIHIL